MIEQTDGDWSAGTFEGARRAGGGAVAAATPEQRVAWLVSALRLAEACGTLQRARELRQQHSDDLWARGE